MKSDDPIGEQDEAALESLLLDPQFQALSASQPFNVFEAMGMVRAEIRHSNFLAYLLDPNASHGLGDRFLKSFLVHVCKAHKTFRTTDVLLARLDDLTLHRERLNIDVLMTSPTLGLVCAIENKIGAREHDDQLLRYRTAVEREYKDFAHHIFVYLTPARELASDPGYTPLGYHDLVDSIDPLIEAADIDPDLRIVLRHYVAMIRNHIMTDARTVQICRAIYQQHGRAVDLIIEHAIDDRETGIAAVVAEQARVTFSECQFVEDASTDKTLRFADPALDSVPGQLTGSSTESRRILLYEVAIRPEKVELIARLGPGDADARRQLHAALDVEPLRRGKLYDSWYRVYSVNIATRSLIEDFNSSSGESVAALRDAVVSGIGSFVQGAATIIRARLTEHA